MKSLLFLSWFESPYTFIAEFSCLNSYNVFTLAEVNILEHNAVYVVRLLLGDFISVYVKCSILLVAIYFHIRHFVFAIHEASVRDVDHRLGVPLCLVEVVDVFARLAVIGHHSLVVHTVAIALMAYAGLCVAELLDALAP